MKTNSLTKQAKLFEGKDHWHLNGEKDVTFSDGPNGLRIEDEYGLGFNHSKMATLFPSEACVGNSFDRDLLYEYGIMIAQECIKEKIDLILGPGCNIKRSPLCGRNFEYFSEDPLLSGEYAAAYILGVQSLGIGTSLKHFLANSRELGRQVSDSIIDERTLHEIYLKQFEIAVKKARPWSIMAAYNKVNGIYCCENKEMFQEARSWGFDGAFVSDWGAVADPIASIEAGLNLEMPGPSGSSTLILQAIQDGKITNECLQTSTAYLQQLIDKCGQYQNVTFTQKEHNTFCQKAAEESIVLLKNDSVLPLGDSEKIGVIGSFALHPYIQGSGSSQVNTIVQDNFLQSLEEAHIPYCYEQGFAIADDHVDESLRTAALQACENCNTVIIFVGEETCGGEGFDRTTMDLPMNQNALIRDFIELQKKVIIVIQSGSPITLPWRNQVAGIVVEQLAGGQSGTALKHILYGDVNPSGHLAETWPLRLEDVPCQRYYDNDVFQSQYREAFYVGYRYYDTYHIPTAYSFGFGLSYTKYSFSNMKIQKDNQSVHVSCTIKNIGKREGRAVAQLYVGMKNSKISRANKELKDFCSVMLEKGQEKEIEFVLEPSSFEYYDIHKHTWMIEKGRYQIMIGEALDAITLQEDIDMDGITDCYSSITKELIRYDEGVVYITDADFANMLEHEIPIHHSGRPFTVNSTVGELKACGLGKIINSAARSIISHDIMHGVDAASIFNAPIRQMLWLKDEFQWDTIYAVVAYLNHHGLKELKVMIQSMKNNRFTKE